jgi:ankyrin repeat protein
VDSGADVTAEDSKGLSPLAAAVFSGSLACVMMLLSSAADISQSSCCVVFLLSFFVYLFFSFIDSFSLLSFTYLFLAFCFKLVDAFGNSPLHHAVRLMKLTVVEYLLSQKASVDTQNKAGRTALHLGMLVCLFVCLFVWCLFMFVFLLCSFFVIYFLRFIISFRGLDTCKEQRREKSLF